MKNLPSIILVPCLALLALLALPCVASPPPAQTMRVQSDAVYEKQSPEREKIQAWLGRQVGADTRGPPKGRVDALGAIRIRYDVAVEPGQAMDWAKYRPLPAVAATGDNATIDTCLSDVWQQWSFRGVGGHWQQAGYVTKAGTCSADLGRSAG